MPYTDEIEQFLVEVMHMRGGNFRYQYRSLTQYLPQNIEKLPLIMYYLIKTLREWSALLARRSLTKGKFLQSNNQDKGNHVDCPAFSGVRFWSHPRDGAKSAPATKTLLPRILTFSVCIQRD